MATYNLGFVVAFGLVIDSVVTMWTRNWKAAIWARMTTGPGNHRSSCRSRTPYGFTSKDAVRRPSLFSAEALAQAAMWPIVPTVILKRTSFWLHIAAISCVIRSPGTVFQISKKAQIVPKSSQKRPISQYQPIFYTPSWTGETWRKAAQNGGEFKMVLFSPFRAKITSMQSLRVVKRVHCFRKLSNTIHFYRILLIVQNQKVCSTWE